MIHYLKILILIILTSFYLFPFEFTFLPGINTKMLMATLGLAILPFNMILNKRQISYNFVKLSIWASLVSVIGLCAIVYNNTNDTTYATYIISMYVWLGGAYFVNNAIRFTHHKINIHLIINYLTAVCVCQCILALLIDYSLPIKNIVDSFVHGDGFMGKNETRLYGIGASLDVAGIRFSAVLILIAVILKDLTNRNTTPYLQIILYTISAITIIVIGNTIARTTSIGVILAFITFFITSPQLKKYIPNKCSIFTILFITAIFSVIIIYYYHHNLSFKQNIKFGFEGFFSLLESGKWEVQSNKILENMIIWPESLKTWIIGDGYFDNPYYSDPYYVGPVTGGFYMNTDIGYLRFIFYFGILGAITFSIFMWKSAKVCIKQFPKWRAMFWMLLILNYIVWFKVSTDIFSIFAIFITIPLLSSSPNLYNKQLKQT